MDCGSNPLTLIKVQRNGDNIRYKYKCLEATASLDVTESWTENNGIQDAPRIHYLDRQNYMNCGNGGFITRFRAKNEGEVINFSRFFFLFCFPLGLFLEKALSFIPSCRYATHKYSNISFSLILIYNIILSSQEVIV